VSITVTCPGCGKRVVADGAAARCPACGRGLAAVAAAPEVARSRDAKRIGHFVVLSELGHGGMGAVYRAWDERLGRAVALKTLLGDADPSFAKRFRREADALGRLRHPNIIKVHEAGETDGTPWLVMELVVGRTLKRAVLPGPDEPGLPLAKRVAILRDVARALEHAHEQGVLHRDLKPENIIVDESGMPHVLDFGLARLREPSERSRLTKTGVTMGTPAYMPPEQIDSALAADERSDVWALGATLYFALAGRPPFEGQTELNVIAAVLTKDPVPPGKLNPEAAGALETICLKCLEKDPKSRYPTAGAVAQELERYLAGAAIAARPLSPLERLGRRAKRRKLAIALTVLALVAAPVVELVTRPRRLAKPSSPPVDDKLASAIGVLARGDVDAGRVALALRTVVDTSLVSSEVAAQLDDAIERTPAALELHRARALLDRVGSLPIRARDLAAIGSITGAGADLELVLSHAANVGLDGADAVVAARSVWEAHPSANAALVLAFAAAGSGDVSFRGDLERALDAAPRGDPRVALLREAIRNTDRMVALLDTVVVQGDSEGTALDLCRTWTAELEALALRPGLARAPALFIALIGPPLRKEWEEQAPGFLPTSNMRFSDELVHSLDRLDPHLTAELVALREELRTQLLKLRGEKRDGTELTLERAEAAGRALSGTDPLLAAAVFFLVSTLEKGKVEILGALERCADCTAAFDRGNSDPTADQARRRDILRHACEASVARVYTWGDLDANDETSRQSLERALRAARTSFELSSTRDYILVDAGADERRLLLQILTELDRLEEREPALDGSAPVFQVEALRHAGKLEKALKLGKSHVDDPGDDKGILFALCAMTAADLGNLDEARACLNCLEGSGITDRWGSFKRGRFSHAKVKAYIEAKAAR
jgi:serine/threonine-protein kinase